VTLINIFLQANKNWGSQKGGGIETIFLNEISRVYSACLFIRRNAMQK
jgi:hypothetical protein